MSVDRRPNFSFTPSLIERTAKQFAKTERIRTSEQTRTAINPHDAEYHRTLRAVLELGIKKRDRTGVGTVSLEGGASMVFDLSEGFPSITSKKLLHRLVFSELAWFISGNNNIQPLLLVNNHIWDEWPYQRMLETLKLDDIFPIYSDEWRKGLEIFRKKVLGDSEYANKWGSLGPVYGYMWRTWPTNDGRSIDQLKKAIQDIKNKPDSRRIIVSAWDPSRVDQAALPPCHFAYQFTVTNGRVSCIVSQRSADMFLGVPFNIASYAALTEIVAHITGYSAGILRINLGDPHIYLNHLEQVKTQLTLPSYKPPKFTIDPSITSLETVEFGKFGVTDYQSGPYIKAPIAV